MTDRVIKVMRKACAAAIWSKGVNISRDAEAVALQSQTEEEVVLRVKGSTPVSRTVVIYPGQEAGEEEWDCDCGGRMMPCEHIAAAAIALSRGGDTAADAIGSATAPPAALPTANQTPGRIRYRFKCEPAGLRLRRYVTGKDDEETLMSDTLTAMLARPAQARTLNPEPHDVRADQLLQTRAGAVLPSDKVLALAKVLVDSSEIYLDGQKVVFSQDEIRPHARVFDREGMTVTLVQADPKITKVVSGGLALCGDRLHPLAQCELTGAWLQHLPIEKHYPAAALGELSARVVPDLQTRMIVTIQSKRLPKSNRSMRPRIQLNVDRVEGGISVLPLLVYGDPPCARIDDNRLVHIKGDVPVRDNDEEQRLRHRLRDQLDMVPGRRSHFPPEAATHLLHKIQGFSAQVIGSGAAALRQQKTLEPLFEMKEIQDAYGQQARFAMSFAVPGAPDVMPLPAAQVLAAFRQGLNFLPLGEHGFAPLPLAFLQQHADMLSDLLAARDDKGQVAAHALPLLAQLCHAMDHPAPAAVQRLAPLAEDFAHLPAAPLPDDLRATLRPYQKAGVDWLCFLRQAGLGALLADDMGLGKTLQTLCAIKGRTLVVCPTSVIGNWRDEIARFRPSLTVNVYHGPSRQPDAKADVTLTSYALLRLDESHLGQETWSTLVLDEAQAIKNPESQTAQAAFAMKAHFRIALSGTPVENHLDELWSLTHFTNRGLLGGRREFDDRYAKPIAAGDENALEKMRARTKPILLRRLKKQVAPDLPPRTEAILHVALDEKERALYDGLRLAAQKDVMEMMQQGGGNVMAALELLLRLRQAACHPALLPGQEAQRSSKVDRLLEVLGNAVEDGHKALVFSQWTGFLDLIAPALKQAGIAHTRLDGSTRDRDGVIKAFQAEDGPPVLLMSLKAGGTGLNLVAADHVFICDPWWNPAAEAQAADRAHRIGQDQPVIIYRLVSDDTVEERIVKLQDQKKALADAAIGGGQAAAGLTRDDLLQLLR